MSTTHHHTPSWLFGGGALAALFVFVASVVDAVADGVDQWTTARLTSWGVVLVLWTWAWWSSRHWD